MFPSGGDLLGGLVPFIISVFVLGMAIGALISWVMQ